MNAFTATLAAWLFPAALMAQAEDPHITGNVPIAFYGKVVDQNNRPVSDVKVCLEVRVGYYTSPTTGRERWDPISVETDAEGNFVLNNVMGGFVQFKTIEKEGYKLLPKQAKEGFMYYPAQFHPDSNNPVVFKMWKKGGAEPLAGSAWHGKVACDGTPIGFDLLSGKQTKDGNLRIICTLTPTDAKWGNQILSDYKLQISITGGEIQRTSDDFTYLAPEKGYLPSVTIEEKAADPNHRNAELEQEFYIKTPEGRYGRLSIDWAAWQKPPTHLEWDCSINPSGSRNLER
ncbi:MAG: carboxypeptidase-like regulatory domain-containing protein [Verrucomicrobiota bacterium]|jgi:hypothetical protein